MEIPTDSTMRKFSRECGQIITPGVDYSGVLTSEHTNGQYEVWKKSGGTYWKSRFEPQAYAPTEYWIVKITDYQFSQVKVISPGRKVKIAKQELYDECDKLGGATV